MLKQCAIKTCFFLSAILLSACQSAQHHAELYERLKESSVSILVNGQLTGSGVFVSQDGHLLSAGHIFLTSEKFEALTSDNRLYELDIVGIDLSADLALLNVKRDGTFPYLKISEHQALAGQTLFNFGSPLYRRHIMQKGHVAENGTSFEYYDNIAHNYAVEIFHIATTMQPGTSGAPWVNHKGEVVGIQSGFMGVDHANFGMAYSAPLDKIKNLLQAKTIATTSTINVIPETLWNQIPSMIQRYEGKRGVVLISVHEEGSAFTAGLRKNDLVIAINGKAIHSDEDFYLSIRSFQPGTEIDMTIYRPSTRQEIHFLVNISSLEEGFYY